MIIKDLNYLEVVADSARVEGGILNVGSFQVNLSEIKQFANASAGNGLLGVGNITAAANVAAPVQTNS